MSQQIVVRFEGNALDDAIDVAVGQRGDFFEVEALLGLASRSAAIPQR